MQRLQPTERMGGGDSRDREDRSNEYRDREPGTPDEDRSVANAQRQLASGESGSEDTTSSDSSAVARAVLAEGNVATRHQSDGEGGQRAYPIEETSGRIGGWDEYDDSEVEYRSPLTEATGSTGRTAAFMERTTLSVAGAEQAGSGSAFVTHYEQAGEFSDNAGEPRMTNAQNQMATYAFVDAVGAQVPRHTYDPDEEWVAVEAAGVPINDLAYDDDDISRSLARQVDREQFIDASAVQLIAGNRDLGGGNMAVEGGTVRCIDLDIAGVEFNDMDEVEYSSGRAVKSSERLAELRSDEGRDEGFVVTENEIATRAQEIAVALDDAGEVDRVVESVKAYDDAINARPGRNHTAVRNNIEMMVADARGEDTNQPTGEAQETVEGGEGAESASDASADTETGDDSDGMSDLFDGSTDIFSGLEEDEKEGGE